MLISNKIHYFRNFGVQIYVNLLTHKRKIKRFFTSDIKGKSVGFSNRRSMNMIASEQGKNFLD